jgi:hypothetical protein
MRNGLAPAKAGEIIEAVIARGDLSALTQEERAKYYVRVCESVGLNPMTRPFEYITLNGKLTLYARKETTEQLRAKHNVSVIDLLESEREGVFIVTAKVRDGKGRIDAAKGAVNIAGVKGEALANAMMKAETKAKRRATLSICGLGFLDESEIDSITPEGPKRHKTLPKKEAKEVYARLQAEIMEQKTREAVRQWEAENDDRIRVLPDDWQDILRLRIEERAADLRQQEKTNTSTVPAIAKSDAPVFDPDFPSQFLEWIEIKLAACDDYAKAETFWNDNVAPFVEQLFPPDAEDALSIWRKHENRLSP